MEAAEVFETAFGWKRRKYRRVIRMEAAEISKSHSDGSGGNIEESFGWKRRKYRNVIRMEAAEVSKSHSDGSGVIFEALDGGDKTLLKEMHASNGWKCWLEGH